MKHNTWVADEYMVWEQCKFRGYWNIEVLNSDVLGVWEQCKFRGYWNFKEHYNVYDLFESSVNSEGIETAPYCLLKFTVFESSVNSEGIETTSI